MSNNNAAVVTGESNSSVGRENKIDLLTIHKRVGQIYDNEPSFFEKGGNISTISFKE